MTQHHEIKLKTQTQTCACPCDVQFSVFQSEKNRNRNYSTKNQVSRIINITTRLVSKRNNHSSRTRQDRLKDSPKENQNWTPFVLIAAEDKMFSQTKTHAGRRKQYWSELYTSLFVPSIWWFPNIHVLLNADEISAANSTHLKRVISNYTRSESPPHCLSPMEAVHLWLISLVTQPQEMFSWWCHVLPEHVQQLTHRMLLIAWLLT